MSEIATKICAQLPADLVPDDGAQDLMLLYALLATTLGPTVTREHVHDAWVVWMTKRGQDHESMVPYASLSSSVQLEDEPFAEAIRHVAQSLIDGADSAR